MADKNQSEEKKLPASRKRLEDARKKGQVSRSKDMVSAVGLAVIVGYIMARMGTVWPACAAMLTTAIDASTRPTDSLAEVLPTVRHAALITLGPLLVLLPMSVVAINLVVLRGIPFSVDPIIPRMERINPAEGFKRLFKLRSFIEFLKSLAKMVALGSMLMVILALGLQDLMEAPACGLVCEVQVLRMQLMQILTAAAILFLAVGLLDVWLQSWLFLRDQRMSVTESKRERKDLEGDPQIRNRRRRLIREAVAGLARGGLKDATLVISRPGSAAVGLRFRQGETQVPAVVARRLGPGSAQLVDHARELGIPVLEDASLAERLARTPPGRFVPEDTYGAVAQALVQLGLI